MNYTYEIITIISGSIIYFGYDFITIFLTFILRRLI